MLTRIATPSESYRRAAALESHNKSDRYFQSGLIGTDMKYPRKSSGHYMYQWCPKSDTLDSGYKSSAFAVSFECSSYYRGKICEMELSLGQRAYAMKKHRATRLHYDLRLEWNGILLSWALPEGPSYRADAPCEAIEMEDHRVANLLFEGLHETGPIMLWDRGAWQPHPEFEDIESCLRKGLLQFTLYGEKLKGGWMLAKTGRNAPRSVWTLSKLSDSFAQSAVGKNILKEQPNSIQSGRKMEQIARDWTTPRNKHEHQRKLFDET